MLVPTVVMGILAAALLCASYAKGQGRHITGLKTAGSMVIQMLPMLILAFVVAGICTGRPLCEPAHCRRVITLRRRTGNNGRFRHRLVIMGGQPTST